jgi:ABC-type branched-subunit amino acid transport system ATPase component
VCCRDPASCSRDDDVTDELILRTQGLMKRFGGVVAVDDCTFDLTAHRIWGLIGPNGSGKTTLFNLLSGALAPDRGQIVFRGQHVAAWPSHRITKLGMGRSFQITRLFRAMTVWENMQVAARAVDRAVAAARANELIDFVGLQELRDEYAGNLSYGQSKLIEFMRILMTEPEMILLDEPFAGVNPVMENKLVDLIHHLQAEGKTFLITDHEMHLIMRLCERVLVLDYGRLIAVDTPEQVRQDERVIEAYFGRGRAAPPPAGTADGSPTATAPPGSEGGSPTAAGDSP